MDAFDPRDWPCEVPWKPIWLDPEENLFCIVDAADYDWAIQWQWRAKPNSRGKKLYAVRSFRLGGRGGPNVSIFMHKAIVVRTYGRAPTTKHRLGDHENGKSLDNRRDNLRWATRRENGLNIGGSYAARKATEMFT